MGTSARTRPAVGTTLGGRKATLKCTFPPFPATGWMELHHAGPRRSSPAHPIARPAGRTAGPGGPRPAPDRGPAADSGHRLHWVHTSEMADPYPYLLGGELLLTAGVHITDAAGAGTYFDDYVARIVAAGGAALGFGVAPVHDTVPRALVEACDRHGLPLLEVPPRTTFSGVARAVWRLMAEARHAELRRVTRGPAGPRHGGGPPGPGPRGAAPAAARLGGRAVLYAPDGRGAAHGGPAAAGARWRRRAVPSWRRGRAPAAGRPGPRPASATDTGAAPTSPRTRSAAGRASRWRRRRQREPGDHTIAGVAVVLLSLLTGEHQGAAEAARSAALVRLLLGATAGDVAPLLGGRPLDRGARARGGRCRPVPGAMAASALAARSAPAWSTRREDAYGCCSPPTASSPPQPGWTLGVSARRRPGDLPAADAQAARALAPRRGDPRAAGPAPRPRGTRRAGRPGARPRPTPACCSPRSTPASPHRDPAHLALPARQLGPHGGGTGGPPQHGAPAHRPVRGAAGRGPGRPGCPHGAVVRAAPRPRGARELRDKPHTSRGRGQPAARVHSASRHNGFHADTPAAPRSSTISYAPASRATSPPPARTTSATTGSSRTATATTGSAWSSATAGATSRTSSR